MSHDANLARHWKYLNQDARLSNLPKSLDKDFYAWKQEFDKKGTNYTDDLKSFVSQLNIKKKAIATTDCVSDLLQSNGFETLAPRTFDGLFVKGWQVEGDDSSEEELQQADNQSEMPNLAKSAFESDEEIEEE